MHMCVVNINIIRVPYRLPNTGFQQRLFGVVGSYICTITFFITLETEISNLQTAILSTVAY